MLAAVLGLCACSERAPPAAAVPAGSAASSPMLPPAATPTPASAPAVPTDAWVGVWAGPEGTFLRIEGQGGVYVVTVKDLDGPRTFNGRSAGGAIHFERNGATESLRPTDGAQTGMKWLAQKSNCLTVKLGEGYCRD